MTIAVNNPQTTATTSSTSHSIASYAVGAEARRILEVTVFWTAGASRTISTLTFDGDALTAVIGGRTEFEDFSLWRGVETRYFLAPDNKTVEVAVTMSASCTALVIHARYLSDAAQQAPEAVATGVGLDSSSPLDMSVTTLTGGAMISAFLNGWLDSSSDVSTPQAGTTEDGEISNTANGDGFQDAVAGHKVGGTAGAQSIGWTSGAPYHVKTAHAWEEDLGAATEFTLTADGASYAWTGQTAGLLKASEVNAESASYAWTGQDATLTRSFTLSAEAASYSWAGQVANLLTAFKISAESASYSWAGSAVTLSKSFILSALETAWSWVGQAVSFIAPIWQRPADTSVTWNKQADTSKAWSAQSDTSNTWSKQSDTAKVWTEQTDTPKTWTEE
jgi:hypothetical protein